MGFDEILPLIGNCGRYQLRVYICLSFMMGIVGLHFLCNTVYQARPKYRCRLPSENASSTYALSKEAFKEHYPIAPGPEQEYSKCEMFDEAGKKVKCKAFVYDLSVYKTTTIIEWQMICDGEYLDSISESSFMVGYLIGNLIFGPLSDRYGRRIILYTTTVAQFGLFILFTFNPYYVSFLIIRTILGACVAGTVLSGYVLGTEMVVPRLRIYMSIMCHTMFSVGYMSVALYGYYIRSWRYLIAYMTIPMVLFIPLWFVMPESPRWLMAKKRMDKAEKWIKKIAKANRKVLDQNQLDELMAEPKVDENIVAEAAVVTKTITFWDVLKSAKMRKRSLIIFLDWFGLTLTYYGLSWNTGTLGGDDFINLFMSGIVELPAYFLLFLVGGKVGRKILLCGSMIIGAIALLTVAAVPADLNWLRITLSMIGKFAATGGFSVVYIFTVEQYPTVIRSAGLGAASTVARIGSMLGPFINRTGDYWRPIPNLVYGALILIGALLSLTMPETLNKKLPETLEEIENM